MLPAAIMMSSQVDAVISSAIITLLAPENGTDIMDNADYYYRVVQDARLFFQDKLKSLFTVISKEARKQKQKHKCIRSLLWSSYIVGL